MFDILKSPRTVACRLCPEPIEKGTIRLTANLGSGHYPKHYHLDCFARKYPNEISQLFTSLAIVQKVSIIQIRVPASIMEANQRMIERIISDADTCLGEIDEKISVEYIN